LPQLETNRYLLIDKNRAQKIQGSVLSSPTDLLFPAGGPVLSQGHSERAKERLLCLLHPGKHLVKLGDTRRVRLMKKEAALDAVLNH